MRSRNIKPGLFENAELAGGGPHVQLTFAGLWCLADRDGRLEDRVGYIKGQLMPYYDTDMAANLHYLATHLDDDGDPYILRYEANGTRYIQITKFAKHQAPHQREAVSVIPPPPGWVAPTKEHTKDKLSDDHVPGEALPRHSQGTAKDDPKHSQGTVMSSLDSWIPGFPDSKRESTIPVGASPPTELPTPPPPSYPLPEKYPVTRRVIAWSQRHKGPARLYPMGAKADDCVAAEEKLAELVALLDYKGESLEAWLDEQIKFNTGRWKGFTQTMTPISPLLALVAPEVRKRAGWKAQDERKAAAERGGVPLNLIPETPEEKARLDRDEAQRLKNIQRTQERAAMRRAQGVSA